VLKIPAISTIYLKAEVIGSDDLDTFDVRMAVLPVGQDPGDADWVTAEWVTENGVRKAMVLIGPVSALPLVKGVTYVPWVKILAGAPEIPVLEYERLHIT
jgi:hypothetical protein